MAVKNAAALRHDVRAGGIAVEVTHRAKRRLFGLTPLRPHGGHRPWAVIRPPHLERLSLPVAERGLPDG